MTKRISVWLAAILIIFACAITFQLTVVFGGVFSVQEPEAVIPQSPPETEATEPPVLPEPTPEEELKAAVHAKVDSLIDTYLKYYVGDNFDTDEIVAGVGKGIAAYSGDKYGSYYTPDEYASITQDYSGEFVGIGVSVLYDSEHVAIEIIRVMENSPALDANLLPDDLILAVNGEDVASLGYEEAVNRIRGEEGSEVTLTVARGEDFGEVFDVTLTRRLVIEESVTYDLIEVDGIYRPLAYIRLLDFNATTAEQFIDAFGTCVGEKAHGFIVDLRNNGGGRLDSVLAILDSLLPEGPMVRIKYKDGTEKVYDSDKNGYNGMVVVLVNGNTASASELFTSALRDYGKAIVVGTNTYGKGTVQSILPFSDGSGLRISTSMYYPPFSENFEGVGIKPDVEVEIGEEYKNMNLFRVPIENDAQLQAAINLFK